MDETINVGPSPAAPAPAPPRTRTERHIPRRAPLTREEMVDIIKGGGSVVRDGQVIAHEDDLPTEDEMAAGDAAKKDALAASIDEEINALKARRARLTGDAPKPASLADKPADKKPDEKKG